MGKQIFKIANFELATKHLQRHISQAPEIAEMRGQSQMKALMKPHIPVQQLTSVEVYYGSRSWVDKGQHVGNAA